MDESDVERSLEVIRSEESNQINTDRELNGEICPEIQIYHITPADRCRCTISISSSSENQQALDNLKYPIGEEFVFILGESEDDVGDAIENGLVSMRKGERKVINIPNTGRSTSDDSNASKHSNKPKPDECPASSNDSVDDEVNEHQIIAAELTLVDLINQVPVHYLSLQEKLDIATHHKTAGVKCFQKGLMDRAFRRFNSAAKYLTLMHPQSDIPADIAHTYRQLRVQCYSNMAACQLKSGSFDYVIENCTKALALDQSNVKCLYRRAEAFWALNKVDLCRTDALLGIQLEPKSKSFSGLLEKIQRAQSK